MEDNINDLVLPIAPYILVEVEQGVSVDTIESEGIGEIPVDNKYVGTHMDVCKIVRINRTYNARLLRDSGLDISNMAQDEYVNLLDKFEALRAGDKILVWSTAVKPFVVKGYDRIFLVKEADIFCKIKSEPIHQELIPGVDYPD